MSNSSKYLKEFASGLRLVNESAANVKNMSVKDPEGDIPEEESKTDFKPEEVDEAEENEEIKPTRGLSDEIVEDETEDVADDPAKPDK